MPGTIILATQRTGSTLLCSELMGIGGLGRPGEHALPWLRAHGPGDRLAEAEFTAICAEGRDDSGAVGLKLMADYLPRLAAALGAGAAEDPPEDRSAALLRLLAARIGPVALFRIDRHDRFAQALSRYLATATGIYFRTREGTVTRDGNTGRPSQAALLESFDLRRMERLLQEIAAECAFLDRLEATLGTPVLHVAYEALCDRRAEVLAACCAHAGVVPPEVWPERWMDKVVDPGLGAAFRARAIAGWTRDRIEGRRLPETVVDLLLVAAGAPGPQPADGRQSAA